MKNYFFFILVILSINASSAAKLRTSVKPQALDTVKIYNVYCSILDGATMTAWGGNYSSFYPAEECPKKSKEIYLENYKTIAHYLSAQKFFWMKLYNTKDQLIYESLKYGDCRVGKFICYWPNGNRKMTGAYDGSTIKKKTGEYVLKKCAAEPTGYWCYYDEEGKFLRLEEF